MVLPISLPVGNVRRGILGMAAGALKAFLASPAAPALPPPRARDVAAWLRRDDLRHVAEERAALGRCGSLACRRSLPLASPPARPWQLLYAVSQRDAAVAAAVDSDNDYDSDDGNDVDDDERKSAEFGVDGLGLRAAAASARARWAEAEAAERASWYCGPACLKAAEDLERLAGDSAARGAPGDPVALAAWAADAAAEAPAPRTRAAVRFAPPVRPAPLRKRLSVPPSPTAPTAPRPALRISLQKTREVEARNRALYLEARVAEAAAPVFLAPEVATGVGPVLTSPLAFIIYVLVDIMDRKLRLDSADDADVAEKPRASAASESSASGVPDEEELWSQFAEMRLVGGDAAAAACEVDAAQHEHEALALLPVDSDAEARLSHRSALAQVRRHLDAVCAEYGVAHPSSSTGRVLQLCSAVRWDRLKAAFPSAHWRLFVLFICDSFADADADAAEHQSLGARLRGGALSRELAARGVDAREWAETRAFIFQR